MILEHYGQLTGSVMVQAVVRKVAMLAGEGGWNIETSRTEINDASLFLDAAYMGEAYRKIFSMIRNQIEPVIGRTLTQNIFKQVHESSRDVYKHIAEVFELPEKVSP